MLRSKLKIKQLKRNLYNVHEIENEADTDTIECDTPRPKKDDVEPEITNQNKKRWGIAIKHIIKTHRIHLMEKLSRKMQIL